MPDASGRWGFKDWMGIANSIQSFRADSARIDTNERSIANEAQVDKHVEGYLTQKNYKPDTTLPDYDASAAVQGEGLALKIKQERLNMDAAIMDDQYSRMGEEIAKGSAKIAASRNPDGSVKDVEGWQQGMERMIRGGYKQVNDRFDIGKINWKTGEMTVLDHETDKLIQKPIPSEEDVKLLIGNYYKIKGSKVQKTKEGIQNYFTYALASNTRWKQWNAEARTKFETWEKGEGKAKETMKVFKQFDFRDIGEKVNVYSTPEGEIHGPEADEAIAKEGWKSSASIKEDKVAEKKAADLANVKATTQLTLSKKKTQDEITSMYEAGKKDPATARILSAVTKEYPNQSPEFINREVQRRINVNKALPEKFKALEKVFEFEFMDGANTPAEIAKKKKMVKAEGLEDFYPELFPPKERRGLETKPSKSDGWKPTAVLDGRPIMVKKGKWVYEDGKEVGK